MRLASRAVAALAAFVCACRASATPAALPASITVGPSVVVQTLAAVHQERRQHTLARRQDTGGDINDIPADAPAGGLSYTQPAITDAVSYYKIASGNPITFGWEFTSLYVSPESLTFQAVCSANSFTYPVGPTTGIPASETQLVWDPWQYAQSPNAIPFAQASYTLRVFDERGQGAAATPGYFNGANAIQYFALYSPAAYTPLAEGWRCVTCSFATVSAHLSHPLLVAIPVTAALILIGGSSVWWR
ncbi:hypothetical protein OIO90_002404 [Microbotryomycetes sp. JL221]|nr:hypothetical protein OIO90_002404 [Microbotryomycetes sp. JL221]